MTTFARGRKAWGECGRCGKRVLAVSLIKDGYYSELMVERSCYEPPYPGDYLPPIEDPVAIERPSPSLNRVGGEVRFPNYALEDQRVNGSLQENLYLGEAGASASPRDDSNWVTDDNNFLVDHQGNNLVFNG